KDGAALLAQMRDEPVTVPPVTERPLPRPAPLVTWAGPPDVTERFSLPDQQSEMRRSLFVAGLRRLARAQEAPPAAERLPLPTILVIWMIAGWFPGHLAGEIYYSALNPREGFFNIVGGHHVERGPIILGIIVGLISAAVIFVFQVYLHWRRRVAAAAEAER